MIPTLNWKEITRLIESFRERAEGLFVERIIVPERPRFPGGYLKGEWAIRLSGRRAEGTLLVSIRPRHPYLTFAAGKGPRAASQATRSPFDQEMAKYLRGQKLLRLEALPRERTVIAWFSDPEARAAADRLGLALNLIPAAPEALLVRDRGEAAEAGWPIITRSRTAKKGEVQQRRFHPPDGAQAPENPPVRSELIQGGEALWRELDRALDAEAFELRLRKALKEVRDLSRQCQERIRHTETALREAEGDQNWQKYGDLLKSALHELPPLQHPQGKDKPAFRSLRDYETERTVDVPMDAKLSPGEQVEKFYQLARRKNRRLEEAKARIQSLDETRGRLERLAEKAPEPASLDWKALESLERAAAIPSGATIAGGERRGKKAGAWLGKSFTSKDGLTIWVGRSRDENLELTFKHARGNDLWMHVRGRPGAHVIVPLQPGKTAPLETLLDAANLTVYYSGGGKWGKTEVDYTHKKYVKRIKDSTEASYVRNKTLVIEPDERRIKRLLSANWSR